MKKIVVVVIIATILIASQVQTYNVFAPELFGDGTAYTIGDDKFIGYVDAWGSWVIYGKRTDCRIMQIGRTVGDATEPIPCRMVFKQSNRFTGWIDFRGHTRKFCGATERDNIPPKCYGDL